MLLSACGHDHTSENKVAIGEFFEHVSCRSKRLIGPFWTTGRAENTGKPRMAGARFAAVHLVGALKNFEAI